MKSLPPNPNEFTSKIPSSPNSQYPNRKPNQLLRDRSQQIIQTEKKAVVKPPVQQGIAKQRENLREFHDKSKEWAKHAEELGLQSYKDKITVDKKKSSKPIIKEGIIIFDTNDKTWFDVGRGGSYSELAKLSKKIHKPLGNKLNLKASPIQVESDHLNMKCCRQLTNVTRENGRAIIVPKLLNRLKQYANSKVLVNRIDEYNYLSVAEAHDQLLNTIEGNMWNGFYLDYQKNEESAYLVSRNLDLLILESYERERPLAIAEMLRYTQNMQIEDGRDAAKITFVLQNLLIKGRTLSQTIIEKSEFSRIKNHLTPENVIIASEQIFLKLQQAIKSVEKSLTLNVEGRRIVQNIIQNELWFAQQNCRNACLRYIFNWRAEPSLLNPENLDSLESKLKAADYFVSKDLILLDDLNDLYDDIKFSDLELTNLSSQVQFSELNLANNDSSQFVTNLNFDPYPSLSNLEIPAQSLSLKKLQKKVDLLNQIQNKTLTNQSNQLQSETLENRFKTQRSRINAQVNEFSLIEKSNISPARIENEFNLLSSQLEVNIKTNEISETLSELISEPPKVRHNEIISSKPILKAQLTAMQTANQSRLKYAKVRNEVNDEIIESNNKVETLYVKAVNEALRQLEKSSALAEKGIIQNEIELKKTENILENVSQFCDEIVESLYNDALEIIEIEKIDSSELDTKSEVDISETEGFDPRKIENNSDLNNLNPSQNQVEANDNTEAGNDSSNTIANNDVDQLTSE